MKTLAPRIARVSTPKTIRVAVYTRVSTDENLDQAFNSLQAQRAACEQYVASQSANGWVVLPDQYNDGGYSGGTIDRPAFMDLIRDVEAGKVDLVLVHKVDRVSRSLVDFVRVTTVLDEHGIAFVSATQPFDTSTPVGRMVVQLLAVFAEFERQLIRERTRAKIHAMRKRGHWTGGPLPLGYDAVDRRLVENERESAMIRTLFNAFIETGSITETLARALTLNITTKTWSTLDNTLVEAKAFTKSTLRAALSNVLYVGEVALDGTAYPGLHEPIVDRAVFDRAQALLAQRTEPVARGTPHTVLLRGLVSCWCGAGMKTAWTTREGRTHGTFVCGTAEKRGARACPRSRIPIARLEAAVVDRIRRIGADPELADATVAAAESAWAARVPEVDAELARLAKDRVRLDKQRRNHITAIGDGGPTSLVALVGDLDTQIALLDERVVAANEERERLLSGAVDPAEVRRLLRDWDLLWGAMLIAERQRVVALLAPRITYDGRTGTVAIDGHEPFRIRAPRAPKPPPQDPHAPRRGSRAALQLALSYRLGAALESGELRDHGHAAELLGVSRARVSQVTALKWLSPAIQARILAGERIPERRIRAAATHEDRKQQEAALEGDSK